MRIRAPWYEDGDEPEMLPAKYVICDRCRGRGHHGNPAFDGLSADDEIWHDDAPGEEPFIEGYMAGKYDVDCEADCENGKLLVPDEDYMSPEDVTRLREWERDEWEYRATCAAERRMGA